MLVLTRTRHQKIKIGDDVEIEVVEVRGNRVKIGFHAPRDVKIVRSELPPDDHASSEPAPAPVEPEPVPAA